MVFQLFKKFELVICKQILLGSLYNLEVVVEDV